MPAKTPIYLKSNYSKKGKKCRLRDILSPDMISPPLGDFRHTIHIGKGGECDAFGDMSFLQGNFELLPGKGGRIRPQYGIHGEFTRANSASDASCVETPSPVLKNAISLPTMGAAKHWLYLWFHHRVSHDQDRLSEPLLLQPCWRSGNPADGDPASVHQCLQERPQPCPRGGTFNRPYWDVWEITCKRRYTAVKMSLKHFCPSLLTGTLMPMGTLTMVTMTIRSLSMNRRCSASRATGRTEIAVLKRVVYAIRTLKSPKAKATHRSHSLKSQDPFSLSNSTWAHPFWMMYSISWISRCLRNGNTELKRLNFLSQSKFFVFRFGLSCTPCFAKIMRLTHSRCAFKVKFKHA